MIKYVVCSKGPYMGDQLRTYKSSVTDLAIAKSGVGRIGCNKHFYSQYILQLHKPYLVKLVYVGDSGFTVSEVNLALFSHVRLLVHAQTTLQHVHSATDLYMHSTSSSASKKCLI